MEDWLSGGASKVLIGDVRCQMSDVRCQMSDVRCQMSRIDWSYLLSSDAD